jgi:hypothetical protein
MFVIMFMRLQSNNKGHFARNRTDTYFAEYYMELKRKKFSGKLRPWRSSKKDFVAVEIRSCHKPR